MKIVYLGTPDFAVEPLKKLIECNKHQILAVITNPDKPVGRKQILTACPVKQFALDNGLKVLSYDKIRVEGVEDLIVLNPDVMVTCAFGQILSQEIIDIPKFGVINIHASLLPKYRGASPIHYAILNGEKQTGVTIMRTDIGIDTGDIITQKAINIGENETCGELFDRLSILGSNMITDALDLIESGRVTYVKQDDSISTTTKMVKKQHALINWEDDNERVFNTIRAFNPAPVAYTIYNGEPLKIYTAEKGCLSGAPGTVLRADSVLEIACGKGSIIIKKLQKAGSKAMEIKDFLLGSHINVGEVLG